MGLTLIKALRQVPLEPGTLRAEVDEFEVVVQVSRKPLPPDPIPTEYLQNVMIDPPWIPDIGPGITVVAKPGPIDWPDQPPPVEVDE